VRDVVKFHVGEHRQTGRHHGAHAVRPVRRDELQPDLQAADIVLDRTAQFQRPIQIRRVERDKDRVAESLGGHSAGVLVRRIDAGKSALARCEAESTTSPLTRATWRNPITKPPSNTPARIARKSSRYNGICTVSAGAVWLNGSRLNST